MHGSSQKSDHLGVDVMEVVNRGLWRSVVEDVLLVTSPVKPGKSLWWKIQVGVNGKSDS